MKSVAVVAVVVAFMGGSLVALRDAVLRGEGKVSESGIGTLSAGDRKKVQEGAKVMFSDEDLREVVRIMQESGGVTNASSAGGASADGSAAGSGAQAAGAAAGDGASTGDDASTGDERVSVAVIRDSGSDGGSASGAASGVWGAGMSEQEREEALAALDRRLRKEAEKYFNKMRTAARRARLPRESWDGLRQLSEDMWRRIVDAQHRYAESEQTEWDRQQLRQEMRMAREDAAMRARQMMGDQQFGKFMRESRLVGRPEERTYQMEREMKRRLDRIERMEKSQRNQMKKLDQRWRRNSSRRGGRRRR